MKKGIRILYLILDGYPTFRPDITALWGRYLAAEGIASDLVTIENPGGEQVGVWGGGRVFLCSRPASRIFEQFRSFFHDFRVLFNTPRGTYDAVQIRDKSFICVPALVFARMLGIPFFYWMSFPMAESLTRLAGTLDRRRQFARWVFLWVRGHIGAFILYRLVLPRADHIFAQSDKMVDDLAASGLDRKRMTAVPMCIDPERFSAPVPHAATNTLLSRKVVGYLGEASRIRRIDFLLEAVAKAREQVPEIYFIIVGDALDPDEQAWLRQRVTELDLADHVKITGWVKSDEVAEYFAAVDVALALMAPDPILDSTSPTKLVEYLAMGRPVVANDHPDQSLVLGLSGAGLVSKFEPAEYAEAIVRLLNDTELRSEMAYRGREWVLSERSYPEMARRLAAIYHTLLHRREKE